MAFCSPLFPCLISAYYVCFMPYLRLNIMFGFVLTPLSPTRIILFVSFHAFSSPHSTLFTFCFHAFYSPHSTLFTLCFHALSPPYNIWVCFNVSVCHVPYLHPSASRSRVEANTPFLQVLRLPALRNLLFQFSFVRGEVAEVQGS